MLGKILRSKLFRSAGVYGGAWLLNALLPFFMLPILTRTLSKESYGIDTNFRLITGFFLQIIGLSTVQSIVRNYYDRTAEEIGRYVVNCLYIAIWTLIGSLVLTYSFSGFIQNVSGITPQWQWGLAVVAFFMYLNQITLGMWQVKQNPKAYGVFQISVTLVVFLFSLLFLLPFKLDWPGRILAQVLGNGLLAVIGMILLYRGGWLKGKYNREDTREATKQGSGLVLNNVGSVMFGIGDRLVLTRLAGEAAAGSYAAAYSILAPIQYISDALYKAWVPWLFERLKQEKESLDRHIIKVTFLIDFGFIAITGLALVLAPPVLIWMATDKYRDSLVYFPYIAFTFCFIGMWKTRFCYPVYARKMNVQGWIAVVAGVLNVVLAYFFMQRFGNIGAGMSSLASAIFLFLATWIHAYKVYPMPWFGKSVKRVPHAPQSDEELEEEEIIATQG